MKLLSSIRLFGTAGMGLLVAGFLCFTTPASAANGEITAAGGGITMDGGIGTHALVGGQAGFRIGGKIHIFGEYSWSQLLSTSMQSSTASVSAAANLANIGGGIEYGFGSSKRVVPYVVTAAGVGHFYAKGSGSSTSGSSITVSLPIANTAYFAAGGGFRFYAGKHWGFKPEVRYQRYENSLLQSNTATYSAGVFWQFGD